MLLFLACVLVLVGKANCDCGEELLDMVAVITDQYRNVDEGVHRNYRKYTNKPDFKSIATEDLRDDICDLTTFASEVFSTCETCPGCGREDLRCAFKKIDLAILLDDSRSITSEDYEKAKQFVADLVGMLMVDEDTVRVSFITFAFGAKVHFHLEDFINMLDEAKEAVMSTPRSAITVSTRTDLALKAVREEVLLPVMKGDREDVPNVVMIISDGRATRPIPMMEEYAKLEPNARFVVIGVGPGVDPEELEFLASEPHEEYLFYVDDFDALGGVVMRVLEFACKDCDPECKNGGECVKMSNTCICPSKYIGGHCQTKTLCPTGD